MSQPLVEVNRYGFSAEALAEIQANSFAAENWPLVYILSDGKTRRAYVGETTDALTRLNTHLKHSHKKLLTTVHLVSSDRFNKSATLDIESSLIKYMAADGRFALLNGNLGLVDHNYYQKDEYSAIFRETWDKLRGQGLVQRSLELINNSDVFKYSPYKTLSADQRKGLIEIMRALLNPGMKNLVVEGGAGTGKSVLAIFLFKLIHTDQSELDLREFSEEENELRDLLIEFKKRYPKPRMALVVPVSSFRKTLAKAFKNVVGLSSSMVVSPAALARHDYDIVLVDEAHRLRRRVSLANYGWFDDTCAALGMDKDTCSEIDWITKQSRKAVYFYDSGQTVKPSDVRATEFQAIKAASDTKVMKLVSQFRVQAGRGYVEFVDDMLNLRLPASKKFSSQRYEFQIFDDMSDLIREIKHRNKAHGLARLVAGFAWPWASKKDPSAIDMEIDGVKLQWNRTDTDWINTPGSEQEVGCIHTTQGYDLNYTGVIFGNEIRYDKDRDQIIIDKANYHDRTGKQSIEDPEELKQYIINIYRTIMLRGIKGTFVYACDKSLRDYLKRHIPAYKSPVIEFPKPVEKPIPYVNAVPLYDLQAAAGGFSELQHAEHKDWVIVPPGMPVAENIFACKVVGESMNRVIPDGSICLFRLNPAGSRHGKIVLVECDSVQDGDGGSRYTVKDYESVKVETEEGWHHEKIFLKPRSYNPEIATLELDADEAYRYQVVGEFVGVVG